MRDYFCSRSTMQLPSTENNFRQHQLHHNTLFIALRQKIARAHTSLRHLPHQYV